MSLWMSVGIPIGPHYNPNWDSLVLLSYLIQALLLCIGLVSCHYISLSTSPGPDTSLRLPLELSVPLHPEEPDPLN